MFIHHFANQSILNLKATYFFGLFHAHNAAGQFFAIMAALGFAYAYNRGGKKEWFLFSVMFLILVSTYSRSALLGLFAAIVAWYCSVTKRFKWLIAIITLPVLLTIGCVMIGYPYFKHKIHKHEKVKYTVIHAVRAHKASILIRLLYTYPRAWYLFVHSPIFGTGVGSYNNRPIKLKKVAPFIAYNAQTDNTYNNSTAHNTYLQILAEQGIVGLTVFLIFWVSLFWYILNIRVIR